MKPMLASRKMKWNSNKRYLAEPKADGYRMLAKYTGGGITFYSRNLSIEPYNSNLQFLVEQLPKLKEGTVLDGELVRDEFEEMGAWRREYLSEGEIRELARNTVFMIFDIYDSASRRGERLSRRRARLLRTIHDSQNVMVAPAVLLKSESHLMKLYDSAIRDGWEGLVVKDINSTYVPGTRSDGWMKMKAMETRDGQILDFIEGKGQDQGKLGSFVVESHGKKVRVSGFTAKEKRDFWKGRKRLQKRWIEFRVMKDSVRMPKFVRFRDDK